MKIISASRRTDIPAFYSTWFINRMKAGFCHYLNPFNRKVHRVSLQAEDTLAITFWTRNPKPLSSHLKFLEERGYYFYFHFSILGYPQAIDQNNIPLKKAIETFQQISQQLSPDRVQWRYDPIVLSDHTPASYHLENFDLISQELAGYTRRCYFSFVDFYGKTERNLKKLSQQHGINFQRPSINQQRSLIEKMRDIAISRGIRLYSCCEDALLLEGIEKAHCIDIDIIRMLRSDGDIRLKAAPTRQDCGCVQSVDIGVYETCVFGCTYCYATNSRNTALKNLQAHDPNDTILLRTASIKNLDLTAQESHTNQKKLNSLPKYDQISLFNN